MRYVFLAPDPETETPPPPTATDYEVSTAYLLLALLCLGCLVLGGLAYLFFPETPAECLWGRLRAFAAAFGAAGTFVVAMDGLAR